jgi:hypothetical protein
LINDLIYPSLEPSSQIFEEGDNNNFSNGSIDVFFENYFAETRKTVIMDGSGN